MKFGLAFGSSIAVEGSDAIELCRRAEAVGFESVWGGEHVIRPLSIESKYPYTPDGVAPGDHDTPVPDPLIWLAYVAAAAPTLRLGTCILIVPQRNPLILAKELATLDRLSGGRVELGIGVGWMKEEFDALGIAWERRGARTDEYLAAMQAHQDYRRSVTAWWTDGFDLLITPTITAPPPRIGEMVPDPAKPLDAFMRSGGLLPFTLP